jgi:hypothetical protein
MLSSSLLLFALIVLTFTGESHLRPGVVRKTQTPDLLRLSFGWVPNQLNTIVSFTVSNKDADVFSFVPRLVARVAQRGVTPFLRLFHVETAITAQHINSYYETAKSL